MRRYSDVVQELNNLKQTMERLPLRTLLIAVAMLLVSVLLVQLVIRLLDGVLKKTRLDVSLHRFIKNMLRFLLYFIAVLMVASYVGIDVSSLVALLSVASLAFSLSVQNVLSNVAGGIMVTGTKPFKRGDYVSVDGLEGTVIEIGMIYTNLSTIDNRSVLIPNSKLAAAIIENFSALGKRRLDLEISASYYSDPKLVMQALHRALNCCEPLPDEEVRVEFEEFGDSAIRYHVHFWIPASRFVQTRFDLRRYVWEEFKAAGVEMTYPHLNVHLQNHE